VASAIAFVPDSVPPSAMMWMHVPPSTMIWVHVPRFVPSAPTSRLELRTQFLHDGRDALALFLRYFQIAVRVNFLDNLPWQDVSLQFLRAGKFGVKRCAFVTGQFPVAVFVVLSP
jgi:hypothetical protein